MTQDVAPSREQTQKTPTRRGFRNICVCSRIDRSGVGA